MEIKQLDVTIEYFNETKITNFIDQFYDLFSLNYQQFNPELTNKDILGFLSNKNNITIFAHLNGKLLGTLTLTRAPNFSAFVQYFCIDKDYQENSNLASVLLKYLENQIRIIKEKSNTIDDFTVFIYKDVNNSEKLFKSIQQNGFIFTNINRKVQNNKVHALYARAF